MSRTITFNPGCLPRGVSCPTPTVVAFLSARFPYFTAAQWRERIEAEGDGGGCLKINGVRETSADRVLVKGDRIETCTSQKEEPDVRRDVRILYSDEHVIVCCKPPNLPVTEGGCYCENTLCAILEGPPYNFAPRPRSLHRLDKETSGIVIVARTAEAAKRFGSEVMGHDGGELSTKTTSKLYEAVLAGDVSIPSSSTKTFDVKHRIGRMCDAVDDKDKYCAETPSVRKIRMVAAPDIGKDAHTTFEVVMKEQNMSFVRCKIHTGRTHQIRAHAESLGTPVLGDKLYDGRRHDNESAYLDLTRGVAPPVFPPYGRVPFHLLHAAEFSFWHPYKEETMVFRVPAAEYWLSLDDTELSPTVQAFLRKVAGK
eukprot:PhM_4_TR15071/c0_g1_i1/m.54707/K06180/rluD; 23S rRNA pseudouridine1911/1915/1917 synthase